MNEQDRIFQDAVSAASAAIIDTARRHRVENIRQLATQVAATMLVGSSLRDFGAAREELEVTIASIESAMAEEESGGLN